VTHTITAGLDGSPASDAAVGWAAREAVARGAALDVVHVRGVGPYGGFAGNEDERTYGERICAAAAEDLAARHPRLEVTGRVVQGSAPDLLVEAARDSEMLVLGCRGLGRAVGYILGSVSLPVAGHARCPVVFVRADDRPEAEEKRLVVGVQPHRPADELLAFAFETAARHGALLRVVHAWGLGPAYDAHSVSVPVEMTQEINDTKRQQVEDVVAPWREKFPGVRARVWTGLGQPGQVLAEEASAADLLMVGRRRRRIPFGTRVGHVAQSVLHHATSPVAVVPLH
jgi:nucleotide-binding universal stress UspA family protein